MCNIFRILHGACAAYIVDLYVSISDLFDPGIDMFVLKLLRFGACGSRGRTRVRCNWSLSIYEPYLASSNPFVSLYLNTSYSQMNACIGIIYRGDDIKVISTSMSVKGKVRTMRCEVGIMLLHGQAPSIDSMILFSSGVIMSSASPPCIPLSTLIVNLTVIPKQSYDFDPTSLISSFPSQFLVSILLGFLATAPLHTFLTLSSKYPNGHVHNNDEQKSVNNP